MKSVILPSYHFKGWIGSSLWGQKASQKEEVMCRAIWDSFTFSLPTIVLFKNFLYLCMFKPTVWDGQTNLFCSVLVALKNCSSVKWKASRIAPLERIVT